MKKKKNCPNHIHDAYMENSQVRIEGTHMSYEIQIHHIIAVNKSLVGAENENGESVESIERLFDH